MNAILQDIQTLGHINYSFVYHDGHIKASTFPKVLQGKLEFASHLMHKIIQSIEVIEHKYNEIIMQFAEHYLVTYIIEKDMFIALLAEKKVNFSLLNMTIKSAIPQIKELALSSKGVASAGKQETTDNETALQDLSSWLDSMKLALSKRIGPMAGILFNDCLEEWQAKFPVSQNTLKELARIASNTIEDRKARLQFLQEVSALIGQA